MFPKVIEKITRQKQVSDKLEDDLDQRIPTHAQVCSFVAFRLVIGKSEERQVI